MKKIIVSICVLCLCIIGFAFADTITINWFNTDGTVSSTSSCTIGGDVILPTTPTKYGYTFQGWRVNYIPLEYIESTGTQWIDTGATFTNANVEIKSKFEVSPLPASEGEFVSTVSGREPAMATGVISYKIFAYSGGGRKFRIFANFGRYA